MRRERVGRALDDFVNIGVIEGDALEGAFLQLSGAGEVRDAAGLFAFFEVGPDSHEAVGLKARQPEAVEDGDLLQRHGLIRIVAGGASQRGGERGEQ